MPGRFVTYLFDDVHMNPEHLLWIRNALLDHLPVSHDCGEDATIAVLSKLDLANVSFRKEADRNRNDIRIVTDLFDANGNYVSGVQKILEMRLRDETLVSRKASGYTVRTNFNVKSGSYMVRLVVQDSEGKRLTALSRMVEVP